MSILVFTGGDYPEPEKFITYFNESEDVVSFVIAADSGLDTAEIFSKKYGFEIDAILGDMDSMKNVENRLALYKNKYIQKFSVEKDYSDTELALKLAHEKRKNNEKIILIGGDGGRLDHLFAIKEICGSKIAPTIWLCKNQQIICIKEDDFSYLNVQFFIQYNTFSIFPVGKFPNYTISSQGLFWPVDNLKWSQGEFSLSNKTSKFSSHIQLDVKKGAFIIILPTQVSVKLSQVHSL